jgi:Ca2+-binding RTX toxin-like protein
MAAPLTVITEAAPRANPATFPLTDSQLTQLQSQGRTVVAYVDIAVTDDRRPYWVDNWTPSTVRGERDAFVPAASPNTPTWLSSGEIISFATAADRAQPGFREEQFRGVIANFGDPATGVLNADWLRIVVGQAVHLVTPIAQGGRGYDGIFLDDVAAYFRIGDLKGGTAGAQAYANLMAQLVHEVVLAVRAVKSDAYIVANSDPFLVTGNITNIPFRQQFLNDIDAQLFENPTAVTTSVIVPRATTAFANETLLFLFSGVAPTLTTAEAWAIGIPYTSPNYFGPAPFISAATAGADTLSGGDGPNILSGLAGHDRLSGGAGNDTLDGGAGFDLIIGGTGTNTLIGGADGDIFIVQGVNDVVTEAVGGGYDIVLAQTNFTLAAGSEVEALAVDSTSGLTLIGNEFQQVLTGNIGNDTLNGGGGNDLLISGAGTNMLIGGAGSDFYYAQGLNDVLTEAAGGGFDVVLAGGNLTLAAGSEVEVIAVNTTNGVTIVGSNTNQTIQGAGGNDRFVGGLGNDTLTGSGGADTFVLFNTFADRDFITDFASGTDKLEISAALFGGGLSAGVLSGAQFFSGAGAVSATTAAQRFIYNSSTGNLLFDADGNGAGAAVLFANLSSIPTLTAADFLIAV